MNNAESEGFSAFAEDGDIKTRIEEFIADAQKLQQSYAVALPLLKLLDTLFIVLAVIQKKDGQMLIQIYYEDAHNPRVCLQFTQSGNQTMIQPKRTMLR